MKLISVIIPVYNVEEYLEQCLQSLMKQTYTNLEIILIDDGSTDLSGEICDKYAKLDRRIVVTHQLNKGVSFSRNLGISMAQGELVGFVDADDIIAEEFFEILYKNLIDYNADVSICNFYFREAEIGNEMEDKVRELSKNELLKEIFLHDRIRGYLYNKLYKKEICIRARMLENLNVCEDLYYLCEVIHEDTKIVYDEKKLYFTRISEGSLTRTVDNLFDKQGRLKYIEVLETISKDFFDKDAEVKNIIKIHTGRLIIGALQQLYDLSNGRDNRKKYLRKEFRKCKNVIISCREVGLKSKLSMLMTYYFPGLKKAAKKLI